MVRNLLKKSNGFMLLCSLSLLMIVMSSCHDAKLKTIVEIANKQCPMDMGEAGKITKITYDGENVVYNFSLNEEMANIKALKANPESIKLSMKTMFQNPSSDVKKMFNLMAECNAGLQMIFTGNNSNDKATCELTPEELKEILNTDVDAEKSDMAKLESQLKMANLQFPMKAGEEITIEKVELSDESVIYICRVDEDLCDINLIEENSEDVKQGIIETLSNKADRPTQLFIKSCLNCNRNIVYRYIGNQSETQYDVVISIPELQDITKE